MSAIKKLAAIESIGLPDKLNDNFGKRMSQLLHIKFANSLLRIGLKTLPITVRSSVNFSGTCLLLMVVVSGILPINSFSQPGSLDNSFGTGGIVITSAGSLGDWGNSVAIQSDGKIVVGGYSQSSFTSADIVALRYNSDGTLDDTFGSGGKAIAQVENFSEGNSLAIQSDGKILLAGASQWFINLVRFNSDGTLDAGFGSGGIVIADVEGYYSEQCKSIAIQSDGKILIGGYGQQNANDNSYLMLQRYNSDGTLDCSFGVDGLVSGDLGQFNSLSIQNDGKILMGGSSALSFILVRYNNDGTLDSTFGTGGSVITSPGSFGNGANSLTILSDGKILLGGYAYITASTSDFALVKYNNDGTLNNTFGTNGMVTTHVGSSSGGCNSLSVDPEGKILLAGFASGGINYSDFAIVRYNSDGTLDNTFGNEGKVITTFGVSYSACNSLRIQSDGKIVVAGNGYNGSDLDIVLARYNSDTSIGINKFEGSILDSQLYPNPLISYGTIKLDKPLYKAELKIYDVFGQELIRLRNISGNELQLSRNNLPVGIYFFHLTEGNKIDVAGKFQISEQ